MKSQVFSALMLALIFTTACGRSNTVYPGVDPQPVSVGEAALPENFFDQSVNQASVELALDGVTQDSLAFHFQTSQASNSSGSYNGSGTGNRAILGISKFGKTKISDLASITFDQKTLGGSEATHALLVSDLNCDGVSIRVLKADSTLAATAVADHGFTRVSFNAADNIWTISGSDLKDPSDPSITLVSASAAGSLNAFLATYPNACLTNVSSGDLELPKNLPTAGLLFALGDSNTTTTNSVLINRISVDSETFTAFDRRNK